MPAPMFTWDHSEKKQTLKEWSSWSAATNHTPRLKRCGQSNKPWGWEDSVHRATKTSDEVYPLSWPAARQMLQRANGVNSTAVVL